MQTLLLPGANPSSRQLMDQLSREMALNEANCRRHSYLFWQSNEPDMHKEVNVFSGEHFELVLAKSIGTLVFAQAVLTGKLSFDKAVLIGTPLMLLSEVGLQENIFSKLSLDNILFISQRDDKVCPAENIEALLTKHLHIIPGSDHLYHDVNLYSQALREFIEMKTR